MALRPWIGVDLDGTLAFYDHWRGEVHIGPPILPMVKRVQEWLAAGKDVRIFTARLDINLKENHDGSLHNNIDIYNAIQAWCKEHIGQALPITNKKDYGMIELWDDRAVQVVPNTGQTLAEAHEAELSALSGKAAGPEASDA